MQHPSQVRLEHNGEVWVDSGDYKVVDDHISSAFEPVKCDVFITESTFGLPIFRWKDQEEIYQSINDWWKKNAEEGRTSVVLAYSLGKAQRVLSALDSSIGPIFNHGTIANMNNVYLVIKPF